MGWFTAAGLRRMPGQRLAPGPPRRGEPDTTPQAPRLHREPPHLKATCKHTVLLLLTIRGGTTACASSRAHVPVLLLLPSG